MTTGNRTFVWKADRVTPAQRILLFALQEHRDTGTGVAEVSLSALQEMTSLSRRGIVKALSELDGRYIERISGGPRSRNQYRILDDGAVGDAQPVAINDNAPQAFNPTSLPPLSTQWPAAAHGPFASQPIGGQTEAFSVNPSVTQALGNGRAAPLSPAGAESFSAQPIDRQTEVTPSGHSVGYPITPDSLSALLTQPVVWQHVKHLAETILALQPSMAGESSATPTMPEPHGESPIQRQAESVSAAQSESLDVNLANPVGMSTSASEPVAGSPSTRSQTDSVSLAPSASKPESPSSPREQSTSASAPVIAKPPGQPAESISSAQSAKQTMHPVNASTPSVSSPASGRTATTMNTDTSVSEPTTHNTTQRQPEPAFVGQAVSATANPGEGVPLTASLSHPPASISPPPPSGQSPVSPSSQRQPPPGAALSSAIAAASRAQPINSATSRSGPKAPPNQPAIARPGGSQRPPSPAKSESNHAANNGSAPRFIPPDWQPGERVYAWATKHGLSRDWVEDQVDEFITFWTDAGIRRRSWDATFIHRMEYLLTRPIPKKQEKTHVISHTGLADKDYDKGATPFDQIPWLNDTDVP